MRRLLISLVALFAVGVVGFSVTESRRAAGARETLDGAAARFVQCYERDASYERCETGTGGVAVVIRSKQRFALASTVEFGPTYSIGRTRAGRLERGCQSRGAHCPSGRWKD